MRPQERPLIWLCSPYVAPTPLNATNEAVEAAANMWRSGEVDFFIPQVMMLATLMVPMAPDEWARWRRQFIGRCDAMLVRDEADEDREARREIEWAESEDVPIFFSLLDLLQWWRSRGVNDGDRE